MGGYEAEEANECERFVIPGDLCFYDESMVRCKRYVFRQRFTQANLWDVIRYEGAWRVCYVPNGGGITSVTYRYGDAAWTCCSWEWQGNDNGYPFHIREAHSVMIAYRGSAHFCVIGVACGTMRHPWVTFVFRDSGLYGLIERSSGVV